MKLNALKSAGFYVSTRTIHMLKVFYLVLNCMFCNCKEGKIVAIAPTYQDLIDWYNEQLSDVPWEEEVDGRIYLHRFEPDSILRDYNPSYSLEVGQTDIFGHGVHADFVDSNKLDGDFYVIPHRG